ncbi:hypothetical protein BpHYR1_025450 [Brachionus plicatilis]|uniref:Uncharacterized protein n=1 Tax=Brachionus plicatilis TaxID=10195 RepID=A0A3M7PZM6_BRAPC|nr:hypothetical protein BpHYR1_025450 [Brachionus plicatilis]
MTTTNTNTFGNNLSNLSSDNLMSNIAGLGPVYPICSLDREKNKKKVSQYEYGHSKDFRWARKTQHGIHYLYHIIATYYELFEQILLKANLCLNATNYRVSEQPEKRGEIERVKFNNNNNNKVN